MTDHLRTTILDLSDVLQSLARYDMESPPEELVDWIHRLHMSHQRDAKRGFRVLAAATRRAIEREYPELTGYVAALING